MRESIVDFIFKWFSGNPEEYCVEPGSEVHKMFGEIEDGKPIFTATTYNNSGYEIWIAYTYGNWLVHFRKDEALQLARIVVWDWWIVSTWCGLKRKIWYWSLNQAKKTERHNAKWRKHLDSL